MNWRSRSFKVINFCCNGYDPSFSRFVTIHSRYRQTTDRQYVTGIAELAIQLQRSAKNRPTFVKVMLRLEWHILTHIVKTACGRAEIPYDRLHAESASDLTSQGCSSSGYHHSLVALYDCSSSHSHRRLMASNPCRRSTFASPVHDCGLAYNPANVSSRCRPRVLARYCTNYADIRLVMLSYVSHHPHGKDKTVDLVLSFACWQCEQQQVKTVGDRIFRNCFFSVSKCSEDY